MAPSARVPGKYAPSSRSQPGLRDRIWWGAAPIAPPWTAQKGSNLMSSTLMLEDKGIPFDDQQQARQIRLFFPPEWVKAGNRVFRVFRFPRLGGAAGD